MFQVIVESSLSSGQIVQICKELGGETSYCVYLLNRGTHKAQIKCEAKDIKEALTFHNETIEELVMADLDAAPSHSK